MAPSENNLTELICGPWLMFKQTTQGRICVQSIIGSFHQYCRENTTGYVWSKITRKQSHIIYLEYGILSSQTVKSVENLGVHCPFGNRLAVQGQNLRSDRRAAELAGLTQVFRAMGPVGFAILLSFLYTM